MKRILPVILTVMIIFFSACSQHVTSSGVTAPDGSQSGSGGNIPSSQDPQSTDDPSSDKGQTTEAEKITFNIEGLSETVDAERVILEKCDILIPVNDWSFRADNGAAVISPDNVPNVSLTLKVYESTPTNDVMEQLMPESTDWKEGRHFENGGNSYTVTYTDEENRNITYYIIESGGDSIAMSCVCPLEAVEDWGLRLADIAATLRIF